MLQTAGNVRALMRHRDNHRNIYGVAYSQKIQIGNRCIQHNSHSTLRLHVLRQGYRPYSLGRPATNAAEHRDIRGANDCIADRLLRSKGIDRKHGIGVTIPNNCKIGGKDKALILRPLMIIPLAWKTASGIFRICCRKRLPI